QAEDGIRDFHVTGVQTCALPISVLHDLRDTVEAANYEIMRLDNLVSTAESVTGTVDSASRLAYIAMANPVIKGVAFASGTAKAARRLRRRTGGATRNGDGR